MRLRLIIKSIILFSVLRFSFQPEVVWSSSLVETRIAQGLDYLLAHPYPYPEKEFKAMYAHLLMVKGQNIDLANRLIQEWCADYPIYTTTTIHPYTDTRPHHSLFTLYLNPQYLSIGDNDIYFVTNQPTKRRR